MAKIKSILQAIFKLKPKKKGKAKKQNGPKDTPTKPYRGQGKRR